ncbi:tetratricopeptide repeat protein [Candidatus Poribacteria bacterium]|nr:tetratricopeptide repeat protein [Candidatus Poribacteria bacterium]
MRHRIPNFLRVPHFLAKQASALRNCACVVLMALLLPAMPSLSAYASRQSQPPSMAPTVPAGQVNDVFDIANEEYKAGNYENAARLYENLLSGSRLKKADVCYNLGNSYFKLNKYGKAIVAYRRALSLAPREQDILANLSYVRNATRDKIDEPRSTELLREVLFFHYGINGPEAETIFLIAYIASALFGMLYLLRKRKTFRVLAYVSLVATLAFAVSAGAHASGSAHSKEAVVVVDTADAHTGPDDHYSVSFTLHDGAELEIRKRENGWAQVELPDGRRGWMKESEIEDV